MQSFRTEVSIEKAPVLCRIGDSYITTGSCFADTIGKQLADFKFSTLVNPFGTIYNPVSIHKALQYAISNQPPARHTYVEKDDITANYDFHSAFSNSDQRAVEKKITDAIGVGHYFLNKANWLMITYGTGWAYERIETGEIVANCHKQPSAHFTKYLLSQKRILESFSGLYDSLMKLNPSLQIILTVSPVRHLRDTLQKNSVSKSVLRLACETIAESYKQTCYFPAYELLLDDLRDYRFYRSDMIHPSEAAEHYIWNKFIECFFTDEARTFTEAWSEVLAALNHRPFHPSSSSHQAFLRNLLSKLDRFRTSINVDKEAEWVKRQLP